MNMFLLEQNSRDQVNYFLNLTSYVGSVFAISLFAYSMLEIAMTGASFRLRGQLNALVKLNQDIFEMNDLVQGSRSDWEYIITIGHENVQIAK
jgi:hypothetical protein